MHVLKESYRFKGPLRGIRPKLLPNQNHVSSAKAKDVKSLLPFCDLTPQEAAYFESVLPRHENPKKKKVANKSKVSPLRK